MFAFVLLGIVAFALLVLGTVFMIFTEVAIKGPKPLSARALPLLSGESLKHWGAARARIHTRNWLAMQPEHRHPEALARRLEADAGELLDQTVFHESPAARGLQRCQQGVSAPQVTAPEAFAIADEVRRLPAATLLQVSHAAVAATKAGCGGCPLMSTQGMCLCAIARPLGCRGRCLAGFDSFEDAATWAETLEDGMIEGLQEELRSANLDASRYNLSEALATVLTDEHVEARWRHGEQLLPEPKEATVTNRGR